MKLSSIECIARSLCAADVPFIVVGGLAVVIHGYGRQTLDLDLVIRLEPGVIRRAFAALASLGYRPRVPVTVDEFADAQQRSTWIREKGMTVLNFHSDQHPETPIDLFVTEPFDFGQEHAAAMVDEIAAGAPLRIVSLPTLIAMKRTVGRPQDLADIAELASIHPEAADA